jgi:hypothetical protein
MADARSANDGRARGNAGQPFAPLSFTRVAPLNWRPLRGVGVARSPLYECLTHNLSMPSIPTRGT